ncbi:hypothetical protein ACGF07_07445 [Kitasatospora sp. NPDC048194]|uniref:hypothetical protein n=1 Tax=Kitasatospora sp. NPDC048194 TaxID=3364045 RepID=UPI00371D56CE
MREIQATAAAGGAEPANCYPEGIERGFAAARQIADAVLLEDYALHPYGEPTAGNALRWQFGVLVPPEYTAQGGEHSHQRTECVMEARRDDRLAVELRFLRVQRRTVERAVETGGFEVGGFDLAERSDLPERPPTGREPAGREVAEWALPERDEGVEERIELLLDIDELSGEGVQRAFRLPGVGRTELVHRQGAAVGRLVRRCEQVDGLVRVRAEELPGPYRAQRLTVVVENTSDWTPARRAGREEALPRSLVSVHLLLGLEHGRFLSVTNPPDWARRAVERCRNDRTWPVLAGPFGGHQIVLSSPIALGDHPRIASESLGTRYDATGVDGVPGLRTAAPTDRARRKARGSGGRAGAVTDLAASVPPEVLERLHGAIRRPRDTAAGADDAEQPWWAEADDPAQDPFRSFRPDEAAPLEES